MRFPRPILKELQDVTHKHLVTKYQKAMEAGVVMVEFVEDCVRAVEVVVWNINPYKNIIETLYLLIIAPNNENKKDITISTILSNRAYKMMKRHFCDDPCTRIDVLEMRSKINSLSLVDLETELTQNAQQSMNTIESLPKIPSIMIIACFVGNRNLERTDKKLFKDYKRKTKKVKNEDEKVTMKAIKYDRLMALVGSLISVTIDDFEEKTWFDQSIDFYSQLNMLVDMKYFTKITKASEQFTKIKYICNVEYDSVLRLSSNLNLRLHDFLHQKS